MSKVVTNPPMNDGSVSPKVTVPSLILFVVGVGLVAASFLVDGLTVDLLDIGLSAIGASGITAVAGYTAKVGQVKVPERP